MNSCAGQHPHHTRTELIIDVPSTAPRGGDYPVDVTALSCGQDRVAVDRCDTCGIVERYRWFRSTSDQPVNPSVSDLAQIAGALEAILTASHDKPYLRVDTLEWRMGRGNGSTPHQVTHLLTDRPRITLVEDR